MEKKILITVDDSRSALQAVRYIVDASAFIKNLHCILFHVQPPVSLYLKEEAAVDVNIQTQLARMIQKNEAAAQAILDRLKSEMVNAGFPPDHIEMITRHRDLGLAQDVIEYSQKNSLDAIVVGRRGVSGVQKFFDTSISDAIAERSQVLPVWLVQGNAPPGKILMAVDGSDTALKAVDYVSFILSGNTAQTLTLLHVTNTAHNYCEIDFDGEPDPEFAKIIEKKDRICVDRFYPLAMEKFKGMGWTDDQVKIETIQGGRNIGNIITSYARDNGFSTLVIGRRGINRSFFMGSVSRQIIKQISDTALWVVP